MVQACKGDIDLRGYQTDSSKTPQIVPDEIYKFFSSTEGIHSVHICFTFILIMCVSHLKALYRTALQLVLYL